MKKVHEKTENLQPIILEKQNWNGQYLIFSAVMGILIIAAIIIILTQYPLNSKEAIAMVSIFIAFYSVFLFFLVKPRTTREVQKQQIITQTYERPVIKEIIKEVIKEIEKPVIKEVIREVEKPMIKEIIKEVEKPVIRRIQVSKPIYIEKPRKKLDIPKYNFRGSTETKTYHKSSCRLGRSIKRKYKESANTERYFLSRGYEPCKVCLKVKKKKRKTVEKNKKPTPKKEKRKIIKRVASIAKRAAEIRKRNKEKEKDNTIKINKTLNKIKKISQDTNKKTTQTQSQIKKVASKVNKVEEDISKK